MATTRSLDNGFKLIDWTDEVNNLDNQTGLIGSMNLFRTQGISQTAVVFDKSMNDTTLLPQVSRRGRESTKGNDRKVETFSLPLAYFKHSDFITPEDIQGWRMPGTPDSEETLANVRIQKLADMRAQVEQSHEYMKLQAAKGIMKTPDGTVIADMFTEFGVAQHTIDFDLGDITTDVGAKISQLKRYLSTNLKTGGVIRGINVVVDDSFFDKLVSHPTVKQAYLYYASQRDINRESTNQFMSWGSVDQFNFKGVNFVTYDHVFKLPGDTTEAAVATDTGHVIPVVNDLFRGYYGPSNKLSGANSVGREMFAYEFTDPKDEFHEMQVETAPLYFCTQPSVLVKLTSST
ncbi:hypothetical protein D3C85_494500 [compost metagenome]